MLLCYKGIKLQVNSLLVNDEETNGSGGEMEEAVEEEIEVFEQDVFLSQVCSVGECFDIVTFLYFSVFSKKEQMGLFRWLM